MEDKVVYYIECLLQECGRPDLIENLTQEQLFIITREILYLCYYFKTGDFCYTFYRYDRVGRLLYGYSEKA